MGADAGQGCVDCRRVECSGMIRKPPNIVAEMCQWRPLRLTFAGLPVQTPSGEEYRAGKPEG
eukprot:1394775-Amorphochlora_amoeboformis.AAC.2